MESRRNRSVIVSDTCIFLGQLIVFNKSGFISEGDYMYTAQLYTKLSTDEGSK